MTKTSTSQGKFGVDVCCVVENGLIMYVSRPGVDVRSLNLKRMTESYYI